MLKRLRSELFCLSDMKVPLIVCCAACVAFGVLTWVTTGGVTLFWRVMRKPALCPPLFVLFILWIVAYLLFGAALAICRSLTRGTAGAVINAAASFFLSLFWCPLFFSAKCVISAAALIVSSLCLVPAAIGCGRVRVSVFLAAVPLWALEAFFLYLNIGFVVLN